MDENPYESPLITGDPAKEKRRIATSTAITAGIVTFAAIVEVFLGYWFHDSRHLTVALVLVLATAMVLWGRDRTPLSPN